MNSAALVLLYAHGLNLLPNAGMREIVFCGWIPHSTETCSHLAAMDGGDVSIAGANRDHGVQMRDYFPAGAQAYYRPPSIETPLRLAAVY